MSTVSTVKFLSHLRGLGVKLSVSGEKLRCTAPEGVLTPDLNREIAGRKAEILGYLQDSVALPPLVVSPAQRYEPFPLTDVQEAYWMGRQDAFELGNVATHVYSEMETTGLDLPRFNLAWQELIKRHEMLRAIVLPDGRLQILAEVPPYEIEVLDLSGIGAAEQEAALAAVRDRMSHQVLPADCWPLFEIRATKFEDGRTRVHLSVDVLIADASSLYLLFKEWTQLYDEPSRKLPPLELTFRDYVLAEQSIRETKLFERSQDYWLERLDRLPPAPDLPLAINPASLKHPRFGRRTRVLNRATWVNLKSRARKMGLTPSGTLLAAFAEVLSTWSRSSRLTLNLTLFNRLPLHQQVNDIVGDFTSLTLLEVDNSAIESFASRAKRLRQQLWHDLDHRHISGIRVMRELARRQNGTQNAGMPVVFTSAVALGFTEEEESKARLFGNWIYTISQTPQVWLDHQVLERRGELILSWDAVEDLFPLGMLDDMFASYCGMVEELARSDEAWQQEKQKLIPGYQLERREEINKTSAPLSDDLLQSAFEREAEAHPESEAVITPSHRMSYGELRGRAISIGRKLRAKGAVPNTLVAVVAEKGWEQVVGVYGVLMSGAAYLPLEADLPRQRMWSLLERGEVKIVLTVRELVEKLEWPEGPKEVELIAIDGVEWEEGARGLERVQGVEDLAYVIFTSGSTGEPKGVMIDHRGAVNTIEDLNERYRVGRGDRVLGLSSLSFDLSVYDIFGLLGAGGGLVLPSAGEEKDPGHWQELIESEGVTVWNTVPALMQMLVEYGEGRRAGGELRLVMLSGDWIPVSLPERVREKWGGAQVVSLGGATEGSIWSIYYEVGEVGKEWKSIPYGRPLRNQRWRIVNEVGGEVPDWVTGQLQIGGVGVARGYWRDEEKTKRSFIEDGGERWYRTGDLGRYQGDGEIEFLGREDYQVKVNGYRIELGEIEAALGNCPGVKEGVVIAAGEARGNRQLVAYVVFEGEDGAQLGDAYAPEAEDGVIRDPVARLEFKLKRQGLRRLEGERIKLNGNDSGSEATLREYLQRQSYREFLGGEVDLTQLSGLLGTLKAIERDEFAIAKHRYPSAGSLYPVQAYIFIKADAVRGIQEGFYYHDPSTHELIRIDGGEPLKGAHYGASNSAIFEAAAFAILLVTQHSAIKPMYGELARDFALLEAGYMGQLLMGEARRFELGLCPIGYVERDVAKKALRLDVDQELIHSLVGGRISPEQERKWLGSEEGRRKRTAREEVRDWLADRLPGYMVPGSVVQLPQMPLTGNGKVDRKALAEYVTSREVETGRPERPQTELERVIADLVREVMKIENAGVNSNLFDLGANSIDVVRLQRKLNEALGRELPIVEIFRNPTISALARSLGEKPDEGSLLQEVGLAAEKRKAERQKRLQRRGRR